MAGDLRGGGPADPDGALVAISTDAGRPLGYGFWADARGTVLTADEVVAEQPADGAGLRVRTAAGTWHEVGTGTLTRCPELGLAWLTVARDGPEASGGPLPVAEAGPQPATGPLAEPGEHVLVPGAPAVTGVLHGTAAALTAGAAPARVLAGVLLLELPPGLAPVPGLPVLDPVTRVVLGLLAPGLRGLPDGLTGAIPLATARSLGPPALVDLLARNAVAAPAYGHSLNLGGALGLTVRQLAAACAGPGRIGELAAERVERADGLAGEEPAAVLTVLVGEPGSGASTELAALAVRRSAGARPLPTLWLRGADLRATDRCLRAPLGRALAALATREREQARSAAPVDEAAVAQVCAAAGRPLLVVLDGPEEAPGVLGAAWWAATIEWLVAARVRLLVACRPESWERYGPQVEAGLVGSAGLGGGPESVRLHRLRPWSGAALELAVQHYGLTTAQGVWTQRAVDPLLLRMAGELRAAGVDPAGASAAELCQGWLDLRCLRIAEHLAREGDRPASHRKGSALRAAAPLVAPGRVRRLAAVVAGRVHEAARRMLGAGQGGLGRSAFEELFPPGGWARAVLGEGLFVPAGDGYWLAHAKLADWLQGTHLDLDAALRLLLADGEEGGVRRPMPRHRVGAVEAALRALGESRGAAGLDPWLHRLWDALSAAGAPEGPAGATAPTAELDRERRWWAARLLVTALRASPEPAAHQELLQRMAQRIAQAAASAGGFAALGRGAPDGPAPVELARFGPEFWDSLALPADCHWALLRTLSRADGPEQGFLASAAARLAASGAWAFPLLCRWFEDGHGLPARPGGTVADLAHDLLYAHRALAVDELTEALVAVAHPRADALLTVLAVEEPSALCRAVDRWSHDPRPERHVAAAVHALRTAPYATGAGVELLRHAALTLLAREAEPGLHGAALALLVRDPVTRARHLAGALRAYAADDPFVPPAALAVALATDAAAVLDAFEARLALPGGSAAAVLRVLADAAPGAGAVAAPGSLPDPATRLAGRLLRARPERAELVAEYLNRRLALGTAARGDLTALLGAPPGERPAPVRRAFALVLATPGAAAPAARADAHADGPAPGPAAGELLRGEFLDRLLVTERDPAVLAPALERLANTTARQDPQRARAMVRRIADAWAQGTGGPERWDALLVGCAGRAADFAQLLAEWPADSHPPAGGPLLARMRVLLAQGRDPQYAAAEAERTAVRPVIAALPRAAGVPVPERGAAHGTL
ncbi:serine protease [Kitasatospora sp. NBC_01250]|uniref:serine protease n=1 Tax=Kitasatospora sp. NBC_01250 TaxID=2903571 RepID=UPI002E30F27D|nr:serine protease [Kitasatospora sp. NBC_01250]